jgi:hypothetical protein
VSNQAMSPVNIWPDRLDRTATVKRLARATSVLLIVHSGRCGPMPLFLNGFQVVATTPAVQMTALVLSRRATLIPPRGFRHPTPGGFPAAGSALFGKNSVNRKFPRRH